MLRGVIRLRNNSVKFRPNDFRTTASAVSWLAINRNSVLLNKRQIHNRVGSELNTTDSYLSSQLVSVSPLTAASSCNTLLITIQPASSSVCLADSIRERQSSVCRGSKYFANEYPDCVAIRQRISLVSRRMQRDLARS